MPDLILASNEFGLNLAKYLPNGVSMLIAASVEGPDVTLRLSGMFEAVVVDIFKKGGQGLETGGDDVREERDLSELDGQEWVDRSER